MLLHFARKRAGLCLRGEGGRRWARLARELLHSPPPHDAPRRLDATLSSLSAVCTFRRWPLIIGHQIARLVSCRGSQRRSTRYKRSKTRPIQAYAHIANTSLAAARYAVKVVEERT